MTTIAQVDQLISSLQNIRASIAEDNGKINSGDFDVIFDTALNEALEKPTPQMNVNVAAMTIDTPAQSFDDYMAMNLLGTNLDTSRAARPNMREFMDATGANSMDASELLYGVIGSNGDYRDWDAIMSSDHPIDAARAATGQLYNSSLTYAMVNDASYGTPAFTGELVAKSLTAETTLGKQGNFAIHAAADTSSLMAVSGSGLLLRGAGSSQEQIERTAWLFGFSTEGLGALASKAETTALKDALESFA
jgi:NAD(P)-dependent dehydrogenase (short-subunit alcohol dehydrogenase family)